MNDSEPKTAPAERDEVNAPAIVAVVLSTIGLVGWLLIALSFAAYAGDWSDLVVFGWNFMVLVVGGAASSSLAFAGVLTGAIASGRSPRNLALIAVGLGVGAMMLGLAVAYWRVSRLG